MLGGAGGELSFPGGTGAGTPTARYDSWITSTDHLSGLIDAAKAGASPYEGEVMPDPELFMAAGSAGMSQYEMNVQLARVAALDPEADYLGYVASAIVTGDGDNTFPAIDISSDVTGVHSAERASISSLMSAAMTAALAAAAEATADSPIADLVAAYEIRIKGQYLRAMSRMAASMADINAVNSSAFVFGMVAINRQMLDNIDMYDATLGLEEHKLDRAAKMQYTQLYMQVFNDTFRSHLSSHIDMNRIRKISRDSFILHAASDMAKMLGNNVSFGHSATQLQAEVNRIRHVSAVEEQRDQSRNDVKDTLYDLDLYRYGGNMLASAAGASMVPAELTPVQSVLGSAAAGAAGGMAVGGPLGAFIGAGIGALFGGYS